MNPNPLLVLVDVSYSQEEESHAAHCPAFSLKASAKTRAEASQLLIAKIRDSASKMQKAGSLEDWLTSKGWFESSDGEWTPRITEGDERLYVPIARSV